MRTHGGSSFTQFTWKAVCTRNSLLEQQRFWFLLLLNFHTDSSWAFEIRRRAAEHSQTSSGLSDRAQGRHNQTGKDPASSRITACWFLLWFRGAAGETAACVADPLGGEMIPDCSDGGVVGTPGSAEPSIQVNVTPPPTQRRRHDV